MKPLLSLLLAMIVALPGVAQTMDISGTVADAKSKEALPYVHLRLQGRTSGTMTNLDGRYELHGLGPADSVVVALAGYRTDTIAATALRRHPDIRLRPLEINLREVAVTDFNSPSALMKEVVRRLPENYHTDTTVGTFFFRRYSLTSDSLWLFCEAMADVMRPGYDKQYHLKNGMVVMDMKGKRDSLARAGNYKRFTASRLPVYDTAMLIRMLGDSNYNDNPLVGRTQTSFSEPYIFTDMLQDTRSSTWLSGKHGRRMDRRAHLTTYDDAEGHTFYLVTQVTNLDSTSLVVDYGSKALIHYFYTTLREDTVRMPFPFNRVLSGVRVPYQRQQYDYALVDGRYTLVFSMQATAFALIAPKKHLVGGKVSRMVRGIVTDDVLEDYRVWTLVGQRPADSTFIPTAMRPDRYEELYYHDVFGHDPTPDPTIWSRYNTVPLEERIRKKLNF